jgi:hypothetical protein
MNCKNLSCFNFATTPTKFNKNDNYIPEPEKFIEALKNEVRKTDTGFVINLSGLHYHIAKEKITSSVIQRN